MKDYDKKIEASEYRAKLAEAELNAVKSSKSYRLSKMLGSIKNDIKSDPVGLTKKAARILLKEPGKLTHIVRTGKRRAFVQQSIIEQTNKYQEWILLNEPDYDELEVQRQESEKFAKKPLISIITPVYNPPVVVLEELIESVLDQTYPYFELFFSDDYGDNQEVIDLIKKYAKEDSRVKFLPFDKNRGIAGASNRILGEVSGDYIALLDHDDTLSLDALYENAKLLNEKPYDTIYSDKDKIDIDGNRFDPLFKPHYSPEMMLNINYLTHLNIMRTSIVKEIGGWQTTTDGAQDWDLFLRVVAASKLVGHIPKVLYHWRVIASSTALSIETKPYALAGQRQAVDNYLNIENIPAKAYHEKTELFLKWDEKLINHTPLIFIKYTSLPSTLRVIRSVHRSVTKSQFVILVNNDVSKEQKKLIKSHTKSDTISYTDDTIAEVMSQYCTDNLAKRKEATVVIVRDEIKLSKKDDWYEKLTGWLLIKDVGATSGRITDRHDLIIDSGGIITSDCNYFPIFYKYPKYYQSYIGNAEWVRDLNAISSNYSSTKLSLLKSYATNKNSKTYGSFDDYTAWIRQTHRIVLSPQANASIYEDKGINQPHEYMPISKVHGKYQDIYSNPNMATADPMRLFTDEPLEAIDNHTYKSYNPIDNYQNDAIILARSYDMSQEELNDNLRVTQHPGVIRNPENVCWVLPSFDAVYAGLMNIFSFAEHLSTTQGLATTFYILKAGKTADIEKALVLEKIPSLKNAKFIAITEQKMITAKYDIAIATLWSTAYVVAKAPNIGRKCYFIQDNEVNFYPKGSISALVENSYRFGFFALANTEGLLDMYQKMYGGRGVVLKSKVDLSMYHPPKDLYRQPKKTYKVFFYARPNMPRNAFELGIAALVKLKNKYNDDVEVITAGAAWDARAYGVEGKFTNLGKIAYEAVPKLYRSVDAGLMFMFSGHPGVTASELMASGCPVVVNEYDDITWHELYQHEKTCLIATSTASEIARSLELCFTDKKLRKKLIDGGLDITSKFYAHYDTSLEQAYKAIIKG